MTADSEEWSARFVRCSGVLESLCGATDDFKAQLAVLLTEHPSAPWQAAFRKMHPPGVLKFEVEFFDNDMTPYAMLTIPERSKDAILDAYRRFANGLDHANREFAERRKHRFAVIEAIHDAIEELD
jgi:hypothetical protein